MRKALRAVTLIFLAAFVATLVEYYFGKPEWAVFQIRWLAGFGTLCAVIVALFSDYLRAHIDPIRITIDIPVERNNGLDPLEVNGTPQRVYCHHLRVLNLTPHKPIKDAQVWLKHIFVKSIDGKWEENYKFAVPRLMEWAPSEFSKDKRTFAKQQVFDLGKTISSNIGFVLNIHKEQATDRTPLPVGRKFRCVFFLTAENYLGDDEFDVEVEVRNLVEAQDSATPSIVSIVTESNWRVRD